MDETRSRLLDVNRHNEETAKTHKPYSIMLQDYYLSRAKGLYQMIPADVHNLCRGSFKLQAQSTTAVSTAFAYFQSHNVNHVTRLVTRWQLTAEQPPPCCQHDQRLPFRAEHSSAMFNVHRFRPWRNRGPLHCPHFSDYSDLNTPDIPTDMLIRWIKAVNLKSKSLRQLGRQAIYGEM